jgi:hypothetical protein
MSRLCVCDRCGATTPARLGEPDDLPGTWERVRINHDRPDAELCPECVDDFRRLSEQWFLRPAGVVGVVKNPWQEPPVGPSPPLRR